MKTVVEDTAQVAGDRDGFRLFVVVCKLPGLRMEIMVRRFHLSGTMPSAKDLLKIFKREFLAILESRTRALL